MSKIVSYTEPAMHRVLRHVRVWVSRKTFTNRLVTALIILGAICGGMTYAALTNVPPFGESSSGLIILLNINLIILLALVVLVSRRIIALYIRRRQGIVGSNLHIRLVFIFSLLAAIPAIFMAIFSVGFFYFGLHGWLDERVKTAINESQAIAEAYLSEHQQLIRADILALANDLNRQRDILANKPDAMARMLKTQSYLRNFTNIHLFSLDKEVVIAAQEDDFDPNMIRQKGINIANIQAVEIFEDGQDGIIAVMPLEEYKGLYIHAERAIDPEVLGHVERASQGVAQYQQIAQSSTRLQIILTTIYVLITLLLTISAVWFGLSFAKRLMTPIAELIKISEKVRDGDLSARVDPSYAVDEFKMLGYAFNRMTAQIETQQNELVNANSVMDFRRRFTETILGGVSTGVLSVDLDKKVTLANNAAGALLQQPIENLLGQKIPYSMPEISPYLDQAFEKNKPGTVTTCEIQVRRQDKVVRTFMARIVVEKLDNQQLGAIITFDDLTSVLAHQRKAAWADIARRIAHEIKNPLTPIQLSAERLNRKYTKDLDEKDRAVFEQCTETIIRHVSDIKRMVNSFAEFAKMPDPDIQEDNIIPIIHDAIAFSRNINHAIHFEYYSNIDEGKPFYIAHDSQQIRQVLVNLIKNAIEAFDQVEASDHVTDHNKPKIIAVFCCLSDTHLTIGVADNGPGLPKDIAAEKLSEPYVTNKNKGTGLGLAIVKKIIEDHDGELLFNPEMPIIETMDFDVRTVISVALSLEKTESEVA